ncbi:MAG: hypothetical protein KJP07_06540, partial [Desulfatitalea sp.]|nr:hypothetical protein [Desulfatitalea sp.]
HAKDLPLGVEAVKKFRGEMGGVLSVIDVRAPKYPADSESFVSPSQAHQSPESLINKENAFSVMEAFQIFAEAGGGESARLIDEEKVVKNMLLLIFGSRWEMYLDEFMKNL